MRRHTVVEAALVALLVVLVVACGALPGYAGAARRTGIEAAVAVLVQRIHQVGMMQRWAGVRAQQDAESPAVRWVGQAMLQDNLVLRRGVAGAAARVRISLPTGLTRQQQQGIRKMARERGPRFDHAFANTLYFTQYGLIRAIYAVEARPSARSLDPVLYRFVTLAEGLVAKEMQWLLATSLVTTAVAPRMAPEVDIARQASLTPAYGDAVPVVIALGSLAVMTVVLRRRVLGGHE